MKTFKQFVQSIREEFWKGDRGRYGNYVEIYKNPTSSEMKEVSHGDAHQQIGGILSGRTLFVWDRNAGEHADVKYLVPRVSKDWYPLYLYYNHKDKSVRVSVSSFSMYGSGRPTYNEKQIVDYCRKHPAFKIFSKVELY